MNASASLRAFTRQSLLGRLGLITAALLLAAALLAPFLAPADPAAQDLPARLAAPSRSHWMGTDELGRDVTARVLYRARISLFVALSVVCGCGLTGLLIGMLAGYAGGWFDRSVNTV